MSVFKRVADVREARSRMSVARQAVQLPAAALLVRAHNHPLSTVGSAAGAGFVLGSLDVDPLKVPGASALLGGGLANAMAYGTRLLTELGLTGMLNGKSEVTGQSAPDAGDEPA